MGLPSWTRRKEPLDNCPGYERQHVPPEGEPHAWIQWKGTQVCMDVSCACGELSHLHGDFTYYVACPACGRVYMTNPHVELIPLSGDEAKSLADRAKVGEAS